MHRARRRSYFARYYIGTTTSASWLLPHTHFCVASVDSDMSSQQQQQHQVGLEELSVEQLSGIKQQLDEVSGARAQAIRSSTVEPQHVI